MIRYFQPIRASYKAADSIQQKLSRELLDYKLLRGTNEGIQPPEMSLLAYEMDPTYTLGRRQRSTDSAIKIKRGASVVQTQRGGYTTFHGPGQLVLYPVLDLQRLQIKVRDYVCILEKSIVKVLGEYNIESEQRVGAGMNGVWIKPEHRADLGTSARKIASVGVHVRRNVTSHGLALNVDTDPHWWQDVVACNLPNAQMVSMSDYLGTKGPSLSEVSDSLVAEIAHRMGVRLDTQTSRQHRALLSE